MSARGGERTPLLLAVLFALLGGLGISLVQPGLAKTIHKAKQGDDVFLLPPPRELRAMSLGYRAAATDLLWAKLLVEYGVHSHEKRPFPDATRYIDGILALEPDYQNVYKFLDTILVYNSVGGSAEDARTARRYFEIGIKERPYDPELWLWYGQYIAFLAPSFLTDKAEIDQWRSDGARAMMRAVELGGDATRSLSASTILNGAGERKAQVEHLQRAYAMTDDPTVREQLLMRLNKLEAATEAEASITVVDRQWRDYYGFLSRGTALLMGPRRSPTACAGPDVHMRRQCPTDWTAVVNNAK